MSPINLERTNTDQLLQIQPMELRFPLELKKQVSCCMKLRNNSNHHVAFKVKTTNPKNYEVKNNPGVILPHSTFYLIVTMRALREYPADMLCKDRFIIYSAVVKPGLIAKDITSQMFNKESGNQADECKLRVSYVPPRRRIVCTLGAIWNSIRPYPCLELESRLTTVKTRLLPTQSTSTTGRLLELQTTPLLTHRRKGVEENTSP